ncbi:rhizobactin siderophore biosynthesis protein RhbC [Tateyamaria omphalii]|uniref:IucA/IucC family protein n=1 Tax=Tateyamaria omphalii TaxID=299262 RepID=UPI00167BD05E|nr:IucA/IucC family protein [Tateyamaria omphalii]GGX67474.1 rhizobactin siderophore biosynthesis protein RhbC [Tateyamaria omphalii]
MTYSQVSGDLAALDAFLNSAMREGQLAAAQLDDSSLCFADQDGRSIQVSVRKRSKLRTLFGPDIRRESPQGWETLSVPQLLAHLSKPGGSTFCKRVMDSLAALQKTAPMSDNATSWNFLAAEQALKAGHPFHPNPRSRDEMTTEETRRYAPEHEETFQLHWYAADPALVSSNKGASGCLRLLAEADLGATDPGKIPLPWHPWQAQKLTEQNTMKELLDSGSLVDLGPGSGVWGATSSMRCIHGWHAPFMVKTSLSLRLTNSIRHLSLREVVRGVHISDLLRSDLGARIKHDFPTLNILGEPGYVALNDGDGTVRDDTIVVLRENPFQDASVPGPVMLASLCETPAHGQSPLGTLVHALGTDAAPLWFTRFLDVAIKPLLELRARYGLLFGAHQQNLMLGLEDGWPAAVWVRDCQGTGHLDSFHEMLTQHCPGIGEGAENVVDAKLGDGLVTYYVVINSVLNTLSTLVLDGLASEDHLTGLLRDFLFRSRAETPGDTALYTRLLEQPTLTCKGNFATSLSGVNEADGDARGQVASFLDLPNPLLEPVYA